jgi:membrane protein
MKKYFSLLKETFTEFGQDKAPRLGAALAYYTIFSIGPLLLICISMAGIFLGDEAAQGKVSGELGKIFGAEMAKSLEQMVQAAAKPKAGMIATIVGVVTLLFGASGVFGQLKDALNTIWNVEPKRASGVMGFVKGRFLSMAMVLGIGFLLLVTLLVDTVISAMGGYVSQYVGGEAVAHALQLALSFAVATVLFAAIFRILPDLKIAWRDVWLGAVLTSILFVLGKWGLGVYLGKAAPGSAYGAAGSLVILLIWVYWSAQILFLGAEFTQVYARTFGSLKGDTSKKDARAQAERPEDRPRATEREIGTRRPAVVPAPMYAKQKSGGGGLKLLAGGVAGLFLGALLGGISAFVMLLKSARKLIMPMK